MRLVEKIVRRNIRRCLNEIDYSGRRESTNVEDRRGTFFKVQKMALAICREIQPKLKSVYNFRNLFFIKHIHENLSKEDRFYFHRLPKIVIPDTGNELKDCQILEELLSGRKYDKFNSVLVSCLGGVAFWIDTVKRMLDKKFKKKK